MHDSVVAAALAGYGRNEHVIPKLLAARPEKLPGAMLVSSEVGSAQGSEAQTMFAEFWPIRADCSPTIEHSAALFDAANQNLASNGAAGSDVRPNPSLVRAVRAEIWATSDFGPMFEVSPGPPSIHAVQRHQAQALATHCGDVAVPRPLADATCRRAGVASEAPLPARWPSEAPAGVSEPITDWDLEPPVQEAARRFCCIARWKRAPAELARARARARLRPFALRMPQGGENRGCGA